MEIEIRSERSGDRDAIWHVNRIAFRRPFEADIVGEIRETSGFVPDLSLVAEKEGRIIGHAIFGEVAIEGEGRTWTTLALGPIAVLPEFQKQGVGGQMIGVGMARAAEMGYGAIILIGHPTYYPRFGFVPASRFGLKTTYSVPDEVFMARLLRPDGLEGVQGTVIYPPFFDE